MREHILLKLEEVYWVSLLVGNYSYVLSIVSSGENESNRIGLLSPKGGRNTIRIKLFTSTLL